MTRLFIEKRWEVFVLWIWRTRAHMTHPIDANRNWNRLPHHFLVPTYTFVCRCFISFYFFNNNKILSSNHSLSWIAAELLPLVLFTHRTWSAIYFTHVADILLYTAWMWGWHELRKQRDNSSFSLRLLVRIISFTHDKRAVVTEIFPWCEHILLLYFSEIRKGQCQKSYTHSFV